MGRKIDKLEKPIGVDYIWGGQNETEGTLESLYGGHYIGLPCNGILIRQFCASICSIICYSTIVY
jgi:hypothetical protein